MRQAARSNSNELAQYYFYVLIHNPLAPEPPGLDAETATLIRRLVWEEQKSGVNPAYHLMPAKERVWQEIVAQTGQLSSWPPVNSAQNNRENFNRAEQPEFNYYGSLKQEDNFNETSRNKNYFGWSQTLVKAGMAFTVIITSLAILFMVFGPYGISNTNSNLVVEAKPGSGKVPPIVAPPSKQGPVAASPKAIPPTPDKLQTTKEVPEINLKVMISPAVDDLSKLLGADPQEILREIQSGQTLTELAASHNTNVAALKEILNASFKRQLDEGVATGKWTQTQADKAMVQIPNFIDEVFNNR